MNIFILDLDPKICAQYHVDNHVSKMILEETQIMCTILNETGYPTPYKSTHSKHPSTLWAKESLSNYLWLRQLTLELHKEFQHRYGRTHKSGVLAESLPLPNLPDIGMTPFAQAMPELFRESNAVQAYRDYYKFGKTKLHRYTKREQPSWL